MLVSKEMGVEGMSALCAFTCTPMCYVLNSLIRSTKNLDTVLVRKSLEPVLAYAKLLSKSLCALSYHFLFVGTLYRAESDVTKTFKDKKDRLDKKEEVSHNFYCPTSFSKNAESTTQFKEGAVAR